MELSCLNLSPAHQFSSSLFPIQVLTQLQGHAYDVTGTDKLILDPSCLSHFQSETVSHHFLKTVGFPLKALWSECEFWLFSWENPQTWALWACESPQNHRVAGFSWEHTQHHLTKNPPLTPYLPQTDHLRSPRKKGIGIDIPGGPELKRYLRSMVCVAGQKRRVRNAGSHWIVTERTSEFCLLRTCREGRVSSHAEPWSSDTLQHCSQPQLVSLRPFPKQKISYISLFEGGV